MTSGKFKERKARIQRLDLELKKLFPNAKIELNFKTPWQLLVAVQLSAQCTDKRVNMVTAELFKKYKTPADYVRAGETPQGIHELEQMVRSCGYYRAKTKNILGAAGMVQEKFGGTVPKTIEELLTLPGVARKTATVVLATAYGVIAGVTVDTHVIRFVRRFDLSDHKDPVKIERDLMELLPKKEWEGFAHRVIHYGRYVAPARKYDTANDPLVRVYPPAGEVFRV